MILGSVTSLSPGCDKILITVLVKPRVAEADGRHKALGFIGLSRGVPGASRAALTASRDPRFRLSQITWRRNVACQTPEDTMVRGRSCDNFLYQRLQGRASARRRLQADVTRAARVAREMPGVAGERGRHGQAPKAGTCCRGLLVTGGGRASPPPLARRRTGAAARRRFESPYRPARATRRYEPRELAHARTASSHERQGDRPSRPPGERSRTRHLRGPGRSALPEPPADDYWCLPEPVKGKFAPLICFAHP